MCLANNIGKEFFEIFSKNFPPMSRLHIIFNNNKVKLSWMASVANLIDKSNTKKLMNKQHKEPPKCNCINKTNCPLKGKCQYESVVYELELYCDNNVIKNKKVYIGTTQDVFKKMLLS